MEGKANIAQKHVKIGQNWSKLVGEFLKSYKKDFKSFEGNSCGIVNCYRLR